MNLLKKILIVDDEPNNRILLEDILTDFTGDSAELFYAADGPQALAVIREERPDLVFLDLMLPELDGLAVCRAVKSEPPLQHIFIAVLTARSQEKDRENARIAGADLYITKPFKTKTIVQAVSQAFNPA